MFCSGRKVARSPRLKFLFNSSFAVMNFIFVNSTNNNNNYTDKVYHPYAVQEVNTL